MASKPLLLIHGFPLTHNMWTPQITYLSSVTQVIAPDLRGFSAEGSPFSIEDLADDMCQTLDDHGASEAIVGGFSMGGYVALALAERHPDRVAGLVLVSTHPYADSNSIKQTRQQMINTIQTSGFEPQSMLSMLLTTETIESKPQLKELVLDENIPDQALVWALEAMAQRPDRMHVLKDFKKPCLIIQADLDMVMPAQAAEDMHSAMPQSTLIRVPNAAHLVNLEQPELVNEAFEKFIHKV